MKYFLILITLFHLGWGAQIDEFAAEVNYGRDYQQALKSAKAEGKMLMLVLVGDYCPWCKKFERKTLKAQKVKAVVNEKFIPVVIDKYKDKGKYPEAFFAPMIPAVYFIDPKSETALSDTVGYMKRSEYLESIDEALALYSTGGKK